MADDDRLADLFKGRPGSVLGAHRDHESEAEPKSSAAKAKLKAAEQKRLPPRRDRGPRLPPGQERVTDWPVLDLGHQPLIRPEDWTLDIKGAVARPMTLSWRDMMALPQAEVRADIHCVTAWSMLDNAWGGVLAATLLDLVQPRPSARHVIFHAHDGYRTNVTLARFAEPQSMLVHHWNGSPIERAHGGPVRALIPSLYLWKSAKWLRQITVLEQDVKGYWEALGYHNEGDPWREERYE